MDLSHIEEDCMWNLTKKGAYEAKVAIQDDVDNGLLVPLITIVDNQSLGRVAFYFDKRRSSFFWFIDTEVSEPSTGKAHLDLLKGIGNEILDEGPWAIGGNLAVFEEKTLETIASSLDASRSTHPVEVRALREKIEQYIASRSR